MIILLVLQRITNFRFFATCVHEGRQLQFLHLEFPLYRYLIRNRIFLFWLEFRLFFLIRHSETPTLYNFNIIFLLLLVFVLWLYPVFTIDIRTWFSNVICSNRFLFFYFDLLAQVLHLIDFFRLSFSNIYFRHFFCFVLLFKVV